MISHNYTSKKANNFILVLCKINHRNRKLATEKEINNCFQFFWEGAFPCVYDKE